MVLTIENRNYTCYVSGDSFQQTLIYTKACKKENCN